MDWHLRPSALSVAVILLATATGRGALPAPESPVESSPTALAASVRVDFIGLAEFPELAQKTASWFAGRVKSFEAHAVERFDGSELARVEPAAIRVFVTRLDPNRLRIFFALSEHDARRYLVRDVLLESGFDEVGLENASQLIYSATLALADGSQQTALADLPVELPTAPEKLSSQAPDARAAPHATTRVTPEAAEQLRLSVGAGYAVRMRGAEPLAHGPRVELGLGFAEARPRALRASAALLLPVEFADEDARVRLRGYAFRAGPWLALPLAGRTSLSLSADLGVDVVRVEPLSATDGALRTAAASNSLRPLVALAVGASQSVSRVGLSLVAELVVPATRTHYDLYEGDERRVWLSAWRVQPGISLGVLWW